MWRALHVHRSPVAALASAAGWSSVYYSLYTYPTLSGYMAFLLASHKLFGLSQAVPTLQPKRVRVVAVHCQLHPHASDKGARGAAALHVPSAAAVSCSLPVVLTNSVCLEVVRVGALGGRRHWLGVSPYYLTLCCGTNALWRSRLSLATNFIFLSPRWPNSLPPLPARSARCWRTLTSMRMRTRSSR